MAVKTPAFAVSWSEVYVVWGPLCGGWRLALGEGGAHLFTFTRL